MCVRPGPSVNSGCPSAWRKEIKLIAVLLTTSWLAGCATPAPTPTLQADGFFADSAFGPPSEAVSAANVFALDESMKRYLRVVIAAELHRKGARQGLVDALYTDKELKLRYDSAKTRDAAQAFSARAGNCLSLVIMTAALAKELGLEVEYHKVFTDDTWSRAGDIYFANTHVNLSLRDTPLSMAQGSVGKGDETTIDFLPPEDTRGNTWRVIGEDTIVAMYMNNRAAESLSAGRLDDAYWWARGATRQDPKFLDAFNTLAVIYQHRGKLADAERVLRAVLDGEPENAGALSNLALVLHEEGRQEEARAVTRRLQLVEPYPPFHFFNLGRDALKRGDFAAARDLFRRELKRAAYYHEVHFGLALAYYELGDLTRARQELSTAMDDSTTRSDHDLYAAKLAWLNANRHRSP